MTEDSVGGGETVAGVRRISTPWTGGGGVLEEKEWRGLEVRNTWSKSR